MSGMRRHSLADDHHLAAFGFEQELKRKFSPLSMLGMAFAILNSWTALASTISLALPSGGSTAVLWGLVTAAIFNLCLASSLAEFLSAYPTAGGQYHWVAMISPPKYRPILSYTTAWISVFGWMALTATAGLLGSQLIVGIIALYNDTYTPQPWHQFLIYIGYNIVAFLVNAFGTHLLPHINRAAVIWSILGFVTIAITVLAVASPNYNSAQFVFTDFINTTGWPDGIAWLLGLLQGGLGLIGFDATAHMIEEIPNAAKEAPKIMIYCVAMGLGTGFIFLMCLLFVAGNPDDVISSSYGPLSQIIYNATGSLAGTVCLQIFPLVCLLFAGTGILTTSCRMTWAFARDRGLPFSRFFSKVHTGLDVPLNALALSTTVVVIFGLIFLGSSSAFNAIVSASVVSLTITYALPPAIHCIRGRRLLPESRYFKLPVWFGWFANIMGIIYAIVATVLFVFPPDLPVTGSNMNYCIVVFAIVLMIAIIEWVVDGHKNYTGPKVEMDDLILTAQMSPEDTRHNGHVNPTFDAAGHHKLDAANGAPANGTTVDEEHTGVTKLD